MGLSVTEKQELRAIISKRITLRIEQLKAGQKDLLTGLNAQARAAACAQLGIEAEMEQLDQLNRRKAALDKQVNAAELAVYDRVKHIEHYGYTNRMERIEQILRRVQKPLEDTLLHETPLGQQIAALTAEQSHLDETVWAATSPKQVSEIFRALNTVLDERPTALAQAAHDLQHPDN